ncbi:MAG: cytochrome b/b6 domain-containing protein [Bacteroidetes bacterium]|nr:cytochrome b/b6 domain-containing protein [Bacteroidota bacterium]
MKTYIWALPTRLFHWALAISFTAAFILGGEEQYLGFHAAFGSLIGGLIFFRIIQGFTGPQYVRFGDFPVSPASIWTFITKMKESKATHPGHNPLASVIMLSIMITAMASAVSGMCIFASGETGIFGFKLTPGGDSEFIEEFHDVVVHLFLILVGIHLTGIVADTIFHRENGTIFSIFTGYKRIKATDVSLSPFQKIFSALWFVIPIMMFFYVLLYQPLPTGEDDGTEQQIENAEDKD